MINENTKIAIVGLGLLGGSYAAALSQKGYEVIGVDVDEASVQFAKEKGWIKEGGTDVTILQDCDLVVFAVYPHVLVQWIKEHQNVLKPHCLITDVTGVKRAVLREIRPILREDVEFIAAHPMAGREYRGITYSNAELFHTANFIIVPDECNTPEAIEDMHVLANILGFKHIAVLSSQQHDRMIGFLSQLTHVIAVSLMNVADNTHLAEYTGDSFRDLTRIAKINEDMWPELFVLNKDYLVQEIEAFCGELEDFKTLIEEEDIEAMKQKLRQSTQRRQAFEKR